MIAIEPNDLRALLKRGNLTGSAASRLAGVNPRTVRRWIGGDSAIPWSAYRLIETHVDQEAMIAEAQADGAAEIAEQDADTGARSPLSVLDERIWTLKTVLQMQQTRASQLEDELGMARAEAAATGKNLREAVAERNRIERA